MTNNEGILINRERIMSLQDDVNKYLHNARMNNRNIIDKTPICIAEALIKRISVFKERDLSNVVECVIDYLENYNENIHKN